VTEAPGRQLSRWTLWFGGLAFFTCYLGQVVLGVIQPTIAADLGLSESEAQWVVNSFFLTLALFAAPGGRLGDYYGHRQVLLVALSIFALGSLSAAVSQGFVWLVASIGVAGIGASTLYPSSAAMIANRVPEAHRGDALGKYSAIGITVFVIGPVMAGLLTEAVTWSWDSGATLTLFGVGLSVLAAFASYELRKAHPLLDVGLLRLRTLRGIVLAMFTAQFIVNGYIIYIATYFQHVLGYGPLLAALAIVPSMLAEPLFNILAGRATDRVGPRKPALVGYLLTAVCMAWIAATVDEDSYVLLLPGLILLSASIAPMFTSLLTGLSNAVAAEERGDANALVLTVRWIGAAAGTMVLGVVIHSGEGATPTASPYATAFTILAGMALAGAAACFLLLRDRRAVARE
jgi:MFS family permease